MHISITSDGVVRLDDPDNFTAFDVQLAKGAREVALAALGSDGSEAPEVDHIFISVERVRSLAGETDVDVQGEWGAKFAEMLKYAGSKGWMSEDRTSIKAHLAASE